MTLPTFRKSHFPTLGNWFTNFFEDEDLFGPSFLNRDITPAVNVLEDDKWYEIDVAAPGFNKDDFKVTMDDGRLTVSAETKAEKTENGEHFMRREFSYSTFNRAFALPEDVLKDDVTAEYKDGILRIRIGRMATPATRPELKKIEIH